MSEATCEKVLQMEEPPIQTDQRNSAPPVPNSALDFAALAQPSYAHTLFLGQNGLRPGWGFTFYVLLFYIFARLLSFWISQATAALWPAMGPRWTEAFSELGSLIAALIPAVILARIEKRPWKVYGLPLRRAFGRMFWLGTLWGFLGISILMVTLFGIHDFDFGQVALHGLRIGKFALYWSMLFLLVGLFEEFLLRGYTQFTLARGIGFWPAAAMLSVTFGLIHLLNEGEQWRGVLAAGWIGLFLCLTLRRTGSLWFAVGFHAAWDWGETFFYSVPDSGISYPHQQLLHSSLHGSPWLTGGTVGPEGSLLCLLILGLAWIAFDRVFPRAVAPDLTRNTLPIQE